MANELTKQRSMPIAAYLNDEGVQNSIASVVAAKDIKRFTSSIVSAVQTTPALKECTNKSILSAALLGEALNLPPSPNLNFFYMIPFKNNKEGITEAQFQMGYKGFLQLAIRSGQYKMIVANEVKEGELKSFNPITEEFSLEPIADPNERAKAKTIGYYAMFELVNGFRKELYWTKEQMESHAKKYSKGYQAKKGYTFWEKDFDGMARKTMLRQLISKWGIMSVEMQRAYNADMGVIDNVDSNGNDTVRYTDNPDIKDVIEVEVVENNASVDFEEENVIEVQAEIF